MGDSGELPWNVMGGTNATVGRSVIPNEAGDTPRDDSPRRPSEGRDSGLDAGAGSLARHAQGPCGGATRAPVVASGASWSTAPGRSLRPTAASVGVQQPHSEAGRSAQQVRAALTLGVAEQAD